MVSHRFGWSRVLVSIASAVGVAALYAPPAHAAFDGRLEIPGVAGEAPPPLAGQIEVLNFEWGVMATPNKNPAKTVGSACGGKQPKRMDQIVITKKTDKATPKLFMAAALGTIYPTVTLRFLKTAPLSFVYLELTMTNVIVSSISNGGAQLDANTPTEDVTLKYATIQSTYTETDPDGTAGESTVANWSVCNP